MINPFTHPLSFFDWLIHLTWKDIFGWFKRNGFFFLGFEASGLSKGHGRKSVAKKRAKRKEERLFKDREEFDAMLNDSLNSIREGRVYKVEMCDPEKSIQRILRSNSPS